MNSTSECKHTHPVAAIISQEIEAAGVISFARFMELALYHPEHGYYNRNRTVIGKRGDFFTSASVGSLFGEMLAFWLKKQNIRTIVEAGAHDGTLAKDILSSLDAEYIIIEPSEKLRALQQNTLANFKNVSWLSSIEALPELNGAIISNELLDAFAVHVYRWSEQRWFEMCVGAGFQWKPIETKLDLGIEEHLPENFTIELSPTAEAWWEMAARKLKSGLILAIDYGDEASGLWTKASGTLRAFRNHRQVPDILANPGEQDLTASVNFTRIREAGERAGLESQPIITQATFLSKFASEFFEANPDPKKIRQFQTLTHPEHLGHAFKVLVQRAFK